MFTRLHLQNYRAFEALDLEFSKLNLFFGPNNSGKSSILSALTLLSQTYESPDRSVRLLLNGKNEELGTYRDAVFRNEKRRDIKIGMEVSGPHPFGDSRDHPGGYIELGFHFRPRLRQIVMSSLLVETPVGTPILELERNQYGTHKYRAWNSEGEVVPNLNSRDFNFHQFLPFPSHDGKSLEKDLQHGEIRDMYWLLIDHLRRIEFLCPFREFPQRTYLFSGESPESVGVRGERAIDILVMDNARRGKKKKQITRNVSQWLRDAEIGEGLKVQTLTDRHYEIEISHFSTAEWENLADVGFGCSQVLPVLIGGYNLSPQSIFVVEQPELHLHPRAQAELGNFFWELTENDIQCFVETHSEHLLLRLQTLIASGHLVPDDISVFYVYPDQEEGEKKVVTIGIDEQGKFTTEWPGGFFPEKMDEARKLAKARRGGDSS